MCDSFWDFAYNYYKKSYVYFLSFYFLFVKGFKSYVSKVTRFWIARVAFSFFHIQIVLVLQLLEDVQKKLNVISKADAWFWYIQYEKRKDKSHKFTEVSSKL